MDRAVARHRGDSAACSIDPANRVILGIGQIHRQVGADLDALRAGQGGLGCRPPVTGIALGTGPGDVVEALRLHVQPIHRVALAQGDVHVSVGGER